MFQLLKRKIPVSKLHPRNGFRPLIDDKSKLMLSLSSKSGSVFGASWFFYHAGQWGEVSSYEEWVHRYRQDIFYESNDYASACTQFDSSPESFTKIKLVRNPYSRAVSSYLHALKHPHLLERDTEGKFSDKAFSFETFIGLLESLGTVGCNPHYRSQTHNFERWAKWQYDYIIKLENSVNTLKELEESLGLAQSPMDDFRESKHHSKRDDREGYVGNQVFSSGKIIHKKYPYFYTAELAFRVAKLYEEDFINFNYPVSIELPAS